MSMIKKYKEFINEIDTSAEDHRSYSKDYLKKK